MRVALWLRVSDPNPDTTNQRPSLEAFASARGWEIVRVYEFQASAYKGPHQQMLSQVYEDARLGKWDVLLCWTLDRLSREGPLATLQIVDRLGKSGAQVISLQEPWPEAAGELRDLLLALVGWVARYESQRRSEWTRAGMARVMAQGVGVGRPEVGHLVDVDLVVMLGEEGHTWKEIRRLHPATIETPKGGHKKPSIGSLHRAWTAFKKGVADSGPGANGAMTLPRERSATEPLL